MKVQFSQTNGLLTGFGILSLIVIFQLVCLTGCAGKKLKPDPGLVETYIKADQIITGVESMETVDVTSAYQFSAALEDLIKEMGRVTGTINNVRKKTELRNLTMEVAQMYARVSNPEYTTDPGMLKSMYSDWQSLKPRFKSFVGDAAEKSR